MKYMKYQSSGIMDQFVWDRVHNQSERAIWSRDPLD